MIADIDLQRMQKPNKDVCTHVYCIFSSKQIKIQEISILIIINIKHLFVHNNLFQSTERTLLPILSELGILQLQNNICLVL